MTPPFPVAAGRYQSFRENVRPRARLVVREGDRPFRDEIDLQAQWFGGEFGRCFTGTGGEKIEILQFGHWNRGAGPDFTEVAVRIDGELRRGALEIDIDVRHWERHGHLTNPDFNAVILHVFTDQPALNRFFTCTADHRHVPQLLLPQFTGLKGRPDFLPEAFPGRCVAPLNRMSDAEVNSLLVAAAQYRLQQKSERLRIMINSTSSEQAMFQAVAEALGFRRNKTAMAILAQRCKVRDLLEMEAAEREAWLFGAAGFLDPGLSEDGIGEKASAYLRQLRGQWRKRRDHIDSKSLRAINWRCDGVRPLNHPQRRVGALACLVGHWERFRLFWEENVNNFEKQVNNLLRDVRHPFWEHHYTFRCEPSRIPLRLIGKDRLRDILGNVIFPGAIRLDPACWSEYAGLGRVDSNQKLRRATLRLFGNNARRQKLFTRYYHQQQGLLQIFEDFCLNDASDCGDCRFPEQLTQWRGPVAIPSAPDGIYAG